MDNSSNKNILAGIALISIATLIAYLPALYGGYVWDDQALTANWLIHSPAGLMKIWTMPQLNLYESHYWPMVYSSFWLEYRLWGLQPYGYHLNNVLLHILNSLLIWLLLRKLLIPGAWLAAALFALHPVHVESVAWIIERKDVLSTFFYLLAFLFYIRFEDEKKKDFYAAAIIFFLLGLLSKSMVISFPLIIGLWLWWKKGRLYLKDMLLLLPFVAVAILHTYIDLRLLRQSESIGLGFTFIERCLLASRSLFFYAQKIFVPYPLMTFYRKWEIDAGILGLYIFPLAAAAILVFFWTKKERWGKGPLVAVLFFAITLAPVLGFVDFNFLLHSYVADRFQYLASLGLIAFFAAFITILLRLDARKIFLKRVIIVLLLGVLGIFTWRQCGNYQDKKTLFLANIALDANISSAYNCLGIISLKESENEKALQYFYKVIELEPMRADTLNNIGTALVELGKDEEATKYYKEAIRINPKLSSAYYNYGVTLEKFGEVNKAIKYYEMAISSNEKDSGDDTALFKEEKLSTSIWQYVFPFAVLGVASFIVVFIAVILQRRAKLQVFKYIIVALMLISLGALTWFQCGNYKDKETLFLANIALDPCVSNAYNSLGGIYLERGQNEKALELFKKAHLLDPLSADTYNNIGVALGNLGGDEEAIEYYEESIRLNPELANTYYNFGMTLVKLGKIDEGIKNYEEAIRLKIKYPQVFLTIGLAYSQKKEFDKAIKYFEEAIKFKPDYPEPYYHLGLALTEKDVIDEGLKNIMRALELKPNVAEWHNDAGFFLYKQGKVEEAFKHFSEALRIRPDYPGAKTNLGVAKKALSSE